MERFMEQPSEQPRISAVSERAIEEAIEQDLHNVIIPDMHAADAKMLKKSFESNFSMLLNEVFEDAMKGQYFERKDKDALSSIVTCRLVDRYDQHIPGFAEKYHEIERLHDQKIREMKGGAMAGTVSMEAWLEARKEKDIAIERAIGELIAPHDASVERHAEEMSAA